MVLHSICIVFAEVMQKIKTHSIMKQNVMFSHDDFIQMIRCAKQRKREWEERVGEKLDALQREIDSKK